MLQLSQRPASVIRELYAMLRYCNCIRAAMLARPASVTGQHVRSRCCSCIRVAMLASPASVFPEQFSRLRVLQLHEGGNVLHACTHQPLHQSTQRTVMACEAATVAMLEVEAHCQDGGTIIADESTMLRSLQRDKCRNNSDQKENEALHVSIIRRTAKVVRMANRDSGEVEGTSVVTSDMCNVKAATQRR